MLRSAAPRSRPHDLTRARGVRLLSSSKLKACARWAFLSSRHAFARFLKAHKKSSKWQEKVRCIRKAFPGSSIWVYSLILNNWQIIISLFIIFIKTFLAVKQAYITFDFTSVPSILIPTITPSLELPRVYELGIGIITINKKNTP